MTKAERLSCLLEFDPAFKGAWVEYVRGQGWFIVASEPRWFGDEGEFIGTTYSEAKTTIESLVRPNIRDWWKATK